MDFCLSHIAEAASWLCEFVVGAVTIGGRAWLKVVKVPIQAFCWVALLVKHPPVLNLILLTIGKV